MRFDIHPGEQAVQRRAGEGHDSWGTPMFGPRISASFASFLDRQCMLILSGVDSDGAVWSTTVAGPPGFITVVDDRTMVIAALPAEGDPLGEAFEEPATIGILAIEPQSRRRIRINGLAQRHVDSLVVQTGQVLGNCPKYIQSRELLEICADRPAPAVRSSDALDETQRGWITGADTFFIASQTPEYGADSSHRGGHPGFVRIDGSRLSWPDYVGNSFYMTLGNLALEPGCGLMFVDWEHGHTLHLTGHGRTDWDERRAAQTPGALRTVEFDIDKVVQVDNASPLRWKFDEYSPHNPPVERGGR